MRTLLLACLALLSASLSAIVHAENKYPIILVHGFAGWTREEFNGFKYWGGNNGDFQEMLRKDGYEVYTAAIGSFASNWDRACELYAFIKGGTVYYGSNHAAVHGHNVTGRTYPGVFPQWGEVIDGEVQKVHLIGHSMGGQTSRMLAQLLQHGTKGAPIQEDPSSHILFKGGHDWIHSISTIATPNRGTTLADFSNKFGDLPEWIGATLFSIAGVDSDSAVLNFFDAKLEQWGIARRQPNETLKQYMKRVFSSGFFKKNVIDDCKHSLSAEGAEQENEWVTTLPNVYYYSFSTADTFAARNVLLRRIHLPRPFSMFWVIQPTSTFLGSRYTPEKSGKTEAWQQNDGVVNTASMKSDGKGAVVDYKDSSRMGRWHHMALFDRLDHQAVIGNKKSVNVYHVYAGHAKLLHNLPTHEQTSRRLASGEPIEHQAPEHIVRSLQEAINQVNSVDDTEDIKRQCQGVQEDEDAQWLCSQYLAVH